MMNKIVSLFVPLALGIALTACEDVPAPYAEPIDTTQIDQLTTPTGQLINESFSTQLGSFKNYTTAGSGEWKIDFKTAKAAGYDQSTKQTTAGTYYLVSQEVDLTQVKKAYLKFDYILRYNKGDENQQLLITDQFDANASAQHWTLLHQSWIEGRDWSTFSTFALNLPQEWMGKKVRIAFRYNTDDKSGSTWEIKNLVMEQGEVEATKPDQGGEKEKDPVVVPTGENLLKNGGFETWVEGAPQEWKSASTASSATLKQSNTARSGKHAVLVEGHAEMNKRLAHQELTLKAGSYTMSFYARGEADNASVRPGYAVVENGSINAQGGYKYGNYVNDLKASEWTLVTHSFQLDAPTTIALLVMNPKGKGNVLIDDFALITADGGLQDDGADKPSAPLYAKSLLDNAEGWTLNEGEVPPQFPTVWKQSEKYGLVATAYDRNTKARHASQALAVSPLVQLGKQSVLTFAHAANYFGAAKLREVLFLCVREVGSTEWKMLPIPTMPSGKDFIFVSSGEISLAAWAGKKVQLGFKYTSTTETAGTWQFKDIEIK